MERPTKACESAPTASAPAELQKPEFRHNHTCSAVASKVSERNRFYEIAGPHSGIAVAVSGRGPTTVLPKPGFEPHTFRIGFPGRPRSLADSSWQHINPRKSSSFNPRSL